VGSTPKGVTCEPPLSFVDSEGLKRWLKRVIYRLDCPKGWEETKYVPLFPKYYVRQFAAIHHSLNHR
jgi:hypothetical protein